MPKSGLQWWEYGRRGGWWVGLPKWRRMNTCVEKIRRLAGGRLGARAEVDLNRYVITGTMNHDKTVSVIDPQVEFGATKLENLVTLPVWRGLGPSARIRTLSLCHDSGRRRRGGDRDLEHGSSSRLLRSTG